MRAENLKLRRTRGGNKWPDYTYFYRRLDSFILLLSPSQPPHISPYQTATLSNLSPSSCWLRSYKLHLKMRNHTSILSLTHPLHSLTSLLYSVSLHLLMLVAHTHTQMQDTTQDARSHAPITQNRRPMLKCHFLLCGF